MNHSERSTMLICLLRRCWIVLIISAKVWRLDCNWPEWSIINSSHCGLHYISLLIWCEMVHGLTWNNRKLPQKRLTRRVMNYVLRSGGKRLEKDYRMTSCLSAFWGMICLSFMYMHVRNRLKYTLNIIKHIESESWTYTIRNTFTGLWCNSQAYMPVLDVHLIFIIYSFFCRRFFELF